MLVEYQIVSCIYISNLFYKLQFQVTILSTWIFSVIATFPGFLVTNFEPKVDSCVEIFSERWMATGYSMTWLLVTTALPLAIMVVLYSRAAFTLWFKRNEANQLTHQQKV